jgi:hypothetical protein
LAIIRSWLAFILASISSFRSSWSSQISSWFEPSLAGVHLFETVWIFAMAVSSIVQSAMIICHIDHNSAMCSIQLLTPDCHDLWVCDYRGYGLVNWFTDHLYTPLRTTSNNRVTTNLHNSQITIAPAKPFPACCAFTSCFWQWLLTVEILRLHAFRFDLHSLLFRISVSTNN